MRASYGCPAIEPCDHIAANVVKVREPGWPFCHGTTRDKQHQIRQNKHGKVGSKAKVPIFCSDKYIPVLAAMLGIQARFMF